MRSRAIAECTYRCYSVHLLKTSIVSCACLGRCKSEGQEDQRMCRHPSRCPCNKAHTYASGVSVGCTVCLRTSESLLLFDLTHEGLQDQTLTISSIWASRGEQAVNSDPYVLYKRLRSSSARRNGCKTWLVLKLASCQPMANSDPAELTYYDSTSTCPTSNGGHSCASFGCLGNEYLWPKSCDNPS